MTLVGKIFVVAIFTMSIVWMGFAMAVYTADKNWKDDIERTAAAPGKPLGYKSQLEEQKKKNAELQQQVLNLTKQLEEVKAADIQAIAKLETANQEVQTQIVDLKARNAELEEKNRAQTAAVAATQEQLTSVTATEAKLREAITNALKERDDYFNQVVTKTDELHDKNADVKTSLERNKQLQDRIAFYTTKLMELGVKNPDEPLVGTPPPVDGEVTAINKNDLIEISLGSDDGVKVGHTLHVYRAGRAYLGRVQIVQTAPDRAVAKILKDSRTGNIQKGDRVATSLKVS